MENLKIMKSETIYKAMSYRWDEQQTADPIIGEESYHLTYDDALKAANEIKLEVGHHAVIDKVTCEGFVDIIGCSLEEIFNNNLDTVETAYEGEEYKGAKLNPEGVIVSYKHHKYMHYAYNIISVEKVANTQLKHESDLINDDDSTSAVYFKYHESVEDLANEYNNKESIYAKINTGKTLISDFLLVNHIIENYSES